MKLILAIINNDDSVAVTSALTREKFSVTKLSTQGGFLATGNTTLLVGSEDERVEQAEALIKQFSKARMEKPAPTDSLGRGLTNNSLDPEVPVGGATVFILSVDKMDKF